MAIILPTEEIIIALHDKVLEVSGGRPGILHPDIIHAATERPITYSAYANCDIHTVCALLLDSLARNHAFNEGNKRTALLTVLFTYSANGYYMAASLSMNKEFEQVVLWVVLEKPAIENIREKLRSLCSAYHTKGLRGFLALVMPKHLFGIE